MTDFIEVFENVYPEGFCEHVIKAFEADHTNGLTLNRQKSEGACPLAKNDHQLFLNHRVEFPDFNGRDVVDVFYEGLQKAYELYAEKYPTIKQNQITTRGVKLQRTTSGGGYHIWHSEQGSGELHAARCLVFMVYLNTLEPENCGETEFLYQQKRLSPVQNSIVFWPAAYTHPHRGNPVYGDAVKYIATGWFICV